jgi:hypothetical protein
MANARPNRGWQMRQQACVTECEAADSFPTRAALQEKKRFTWKPADEEAYMLGFGKTSWERDGQELAPRENAGSAPGYGALGRGCMLHDTAGGPVPPGETADLPSCVVDSCDEPREAATQLCAKHGKLLAPIEPGSRAPAGAAREQPASAPLGDKLAALGPLPPLVIPAPLPLPMSHKL